MLEPKYLKTLMCPKCGTGGLSVSSKYLQCRACAQKYPVVGGVVDFLIEEDLGGDLHKTLEMWEKEYRKQKKNLNLSFDKNPYLASGLNHVKKFFNGKGRFLEAGCGCAKISALLAKDGVDVYGIDISLQAVQNAHAIFEKEGIRGLFVRGDMLNMPFKDGVFDFIYAGGAIEHFEDTRKCAVEFYRVTKEGGSVNATVPNISLSTPYLLLTGNMPDLPIIREVLRVVNFKLLKGKHLIFGFEKSFFWFQLIRLFKNAGFDSITTGPLISFWEIKFIRNQILKNAFRYVTKLRPFWPMIYVNAKKER